MEGSSSIDRQENFTQTADQRQDARFVVESPAQHTVKIVFGHVELKAECLDYSPFGLGLRLRLSSDLPLFSIGESVDLDCDFSGSRFRARGSVANTRVERTPNGDFVRLGVVLSRSADVLRPAHVKRRSARIQMNEGVSPLAIFSDRLLFGDPIFAKLTDISSGGMRLIVDRHPLPFLEKQRHWVELILPVFGKCRLFCKIAYVRREETSQRYIVGCEFVDGGGQDDMSFLEDWLFYCNYWLTRTDIRLAGFALSHVSANDEKHRVLLSAISYLPSISEASNTRPIELSYAGDANFGEREYERFELSVNHKTELLRMTVALSSVEKIILFESVEGGCVPLEILKSIWKSIFIFAMTNRIVDLDFAASQSGSDFVRSSLTEVKEDSALVNLKLDDVLAGRGIHWLIWRHAYKELSRKSKFTLPKLNSFISKLLVI